MSPTGTTSPVREWVGPVLALLLSVALLLLPGGVRRTVATGLEYSVFAPYRYAVGWGGGSLASRLELRRIASLRTEERLREDRMREIAEENRRLRLLLGFRRRTGEGLQPATVLSRERGRAGDLLVVELEPGIEVPVGAPVLVPEGLLGQALSQDDRRLRVQCLTNPNTTVSVIDQRTRDEGILRGSLERRSQLVVLDVPVQADWRVGDRVITSGLGTIFPRGLLVGTVTGTRREEIGPLVRVWVEPAASPARAEEVFVLTGREEPADEMEWFPADPEPALLRLALDDGRGLTFGPQPTP